MTDNRWRIAGLALTGMLIAARGQAQTGPFDGLRQQLRSGDTVVVTDTGGKEQKGRVLEVTGASLVLQTAGAADPQRFVPSDVNSITRRDSVRNGAAIGAAAALGGFVGLALLGGRLSAIGCGANEPGASIIACLGLVAAGGAVAGAAVDASMSTTLYSASGGRATLRIAPALGADRAALKLSFAF